MYNQSDKGKHLSEQDQRREEKRRLIIESALKAYSQYGIEGTKIKDIADIAGIGKSTIYEYFDSKEDIEKATINNFLFQVDASSAELYQMIEQDPIASLLNLLDNMFDIPTKQPDIYNFYVQWLLRASIKGKDAMKKEIAPMINNAVTPMKHILQIGMDKKLIKGDIDAYYFALMIGSVLDGLGFAFLFYDDEETRFELKETAKELILTRLGIDYEKKKLSS